MAADNVVEQEAPTQGGDDTRERSTIQFPYNDLEDAEKVANALHQIGGTGENDQLGAQLKVSSSTGAFRYRLQVTRMFGLLTYERGTAALTPLGSRICDPKAVKSARAEAFLNIPLYRRTFDEFKGGTLPPTNEGVEAALVRFGVAKKVSDKARQVMQRSATFAGFFWAGNDRMVMPSGTQTTIPADPTITDEQNRADLDKNNGKGKGGGDDGGRHQLIAGLIKTLPQEGSEWSLEDRHRWLQLAAGIFDFVYKTKPTSGNDRVLKIELTAKS